MDDVLWNLNPPEKIDKFKTGSDSTTLNDLVVSARKKQKYSLCHDPHLMSRTDEERQPKPLHVLPVRW